MSYRKKITILFLSSIAGFVAGLILTAPEHVGLCGEYKYSCQDVLGAIGQPVGLLSLSLIIISIILFFTKEQVFKIWKRFAVWFLPIILFFILITPAGCGGLLGAGCLFDKEIATMTFSGLFFIISLLIITIKSISLRNQEKKQKLN